MQLKIPVCKKSSMMDYLQTIGKVDLLTPKEEIDLAKRIKNGDHEALETLVLANLRVVLSIARPYQGKGLPFCQLINEGNLGLVKAAQNFDETKGYKFVSYAVWWIRQLITDAFKNGGIKKV